VTQLWSADLEGRTVRLLQTMGAAHFAGFLDEAQNQMLLDAFFGAMDGANEAALPSVPLPRFRRLLTRAANIAGKGGTVLRLPEPVNRDMLERWPARLCQYVALKLLYDHPFRDWLGRLDTAALNGLIDRAVNRTEAEARKINARKDDADRRALITARARQIGRLGAGESIQGFLFRLSAETASEMRVQSGYESDSELAREQAGYIEDLRCDVLALAFDHYIGEAGFRFLTELPAEAELPAEPLCNLARLRRAEVDASVEDWQAVLYFLLHLVPVDDIGRLLHQIRKWDLLAGGNDGAAEADSSIATRERVRQIMRTLGLYLDMHDAKFEGGAALAVLATYKELFETETSFDRLFPAPISPLDDGRVPRRGLREIMRFGHLPTLLAIFHRYTVRDAEVKALLAAETATDGPSAVADAQSERERLHDDWSGDRKRFTGDACRRYVEALVVVMRHRHSAAHVMLGNHVRLHRLMMAVLGRLVDFSGLWERDLYFSILALMHREGLTPREVFKDRGLEMLSGGQVVAARRNLVAPGIEAELARHFGRSDDERIKVRNDLAHFNMINAAKSDGQPPDLTACVNAARRLVDHDRKLKNAVSQSVIELLKREGIDLTWEMDASAGGHRLTNARIAVRQATHLGGMKLPEAANARGSGRPRFHLIKESLHGDRLGDMVAELFAGVRVPAGIDVSGIPMERIAWNEVNQPRKTGPKRPGAPTGRTHPGRRWRGNQ
jgi:hypothetical protein